MIKVCISGRACSGKTTLGNALAEALNIEHIGNTYKAHVKSNKELAKFTLNASKKFTNDFDKEIARKAAKTNCVVTTRLGPWMVKNATVRVWLNASDAERARRFAKREGVTARIAKASLTKIDGAVYRKFKKVYGIDVENDHDVFDMELCSERMSTKEMVSMVSLLAMERDGSSFG